MRIDAHHHFWDYESHGADYVWMGEEDLCLKKNFLPDDLFPLLKQAGIDGTVAVQARELAQETDFLLTLAQQYPFIKGVVGWLDLCNPEIEAQLAKVAEDSALKGLRMLIHDQPDVNFADSQDHLRGVALLEKYDLTYDLLLRPEHIASAIRLVDQLPNQRFVIDHIAKPKLETTPSMQWCNAMQEIAQRPNVYCKLSGLATLAPRDLPIQQLVARYLDHILTVFGADRCMIGSDWPVCTLNSEYISTIDLVRNFIHTLTVAEQNAILGNTCEKFYGII